MGLNIRGTGRLVFSCSLVFWAVFVLFVLWLLCRVLCPVLFLRFLRHCRSVLCAVLWFCVWSLCSCIAVLFLAFVSLCSASHAQVYIMYIIGQATKRLLCVFGLFSHKLLYFRKTLSNWHIFFFIYRALISCPQLLFLVYHTIRSF